MSHARAARAALGRADLIAALAASDRSTAEAIGAQLGLLRQRDAQPEDDPKTGAQRETAARPSSPKGEPTVREDRPRAPAGFWLAVSVEPFGDDVVRKRSAPPVFRSWHNKPPGPPVFHPLTAWSELAPRLRRVLIDLHEGRGIDMDRTVHAISRGRILDRFPRERRRRWGPALMLLEDDSRRLIPFRLDRRLIRGALTRLLPGHALGRALVCDGVPMPRALPDSVIAWPPPPDSAGQGMALRGAGRSLVRRAAQYRCGRPRNGCANARPRGPDRRSDRSA